MFTGVGRAAIGCSSDDIVWFIGFGDSIGRPYKEFRWDKILRSLRRNLARRFWNHTCDGELIDGELMILQIFHSDKLRSPLLV